MNENISREPDPLADLLAPPALPADVQGPPAELWERTRGVLRWRRRRWRRTAWAAALAACYAAGVLTMRGLTPTPPVREVARHPGPAERPQPRREEQAPPETPLDEEWLALERGTGQARAELYRRAGDRYLAEDSDAESAVRCYGEALDGARQEDLAVSAADSWLLMVIKDARLKEKRDGEVAN
jgi:hypothetical protein